MTRSSLTVCALALCSWMARPACAQPRVEYGYPPPQLEPPPPSGIGAMVVGFVGLGLAGINLASIPVCYADFYTQGDEDLSRVCMIASSVVAGVALAVGVPSLVVGLHRRERHKAWRARQLVSPWGDRSGAGVQYALRF